MCRKSLVRKCFPVSFGQLPALTCHPLKAQSAHIAQILNTDYGKATITHPYHPLFGKTFPILKIRKFPSGRFFSLLAEDDVFCVPESWAIPKEANYSDNSLFNAEVLRSLLDYMQIYQENIDKSET